MVEPISFSPIASLPERVGRTPLLRLAHAVRNPNVRIGNDRDICRNLEKAETGQSVHSLDRRAARCAFSWTRRAEAHPFFMGSALHDPSLVDETIEVTTEEAYAMVRWLAREEGLLVGVSSGAAMFAVRVAERIEHGIVVTIFADNGTKYLHDRFWEK